MRNIPMHKYYQSGVFILIMLSSGCDVTPNETIINNYYTSDSLTNPNIIPKVYFTFPSNGSIGPFKNATSVNQQSFPEITLQFNKLIDISNIPDNSFRIQSEQGTSELYFSNISSPYLRNILTLYYPKYYRAAKKYTITIDTALFDVHGLSLSQPYVFSYIPEPRFRVYAGSPTFTGIDPITYQRPHLFLNSSVDTTMYGHIKITPPMKGNWSFSDGQNSSVDSTHIYFISADTLIHGTKYSVTVDGSAKDSKGLLIDAPYEYSFSTISFKVSSIIPSTSTSPDGYKVYDKIKATFNVVMDTSTVRSSISIDPKISFTISFQDTPLYQNITVLPSITEQRAVETTYTLTIAKTLRSYNGALLDTVYHYNFRTGR